MEMMKAAMIMKPRKKSSISSFSLSSVSSIFRFYNNNSSSTPISNSSSRSNSVNNAHRGSGGNGDKRHRNHSEDYRNNDDYNNDDYNDDDTNENNNNNNAKKISQCSSASSVSFPVYGFSPTLYCDGHPMIDEHNNHNDRHNHHHHHHHSHNHNNNNHCQRHSGGGGGDSGKIWEGVIHKRSSSLPVSSHDKHNNNNNNGSSGHFTHLKSCEEDFAAIMMAPLTKPATETELENYRLAKIKLGGLLRELKQPADKVHYRVKRTINDLRDLYEQELKQNCQLALSTIPTTTTTTTTNDDDDNPKKEEDECMSTTTMQRSRANSCESEETAALARAKLMQIQNQGMSTTRIHCSSSDSIKYNNDNNHGAENDDDDDVAPRVFCGSCVRLRS